MVTLKITRETQNEGLWGQTWLGTRRMSDVGPVTCSQQKQAQVPTAAKRGCGAGDRACKDGQGGRALGVFLPVLITIRYGTALFCHFKLS